MHPGMMKKGYVTSTIEQPFFVKDGVMQSSRGGTGRLAPPITISSRRSFGKAIPKKKRDAPDQIAVSLGLSESDVKMALEDYEAPKRKALV